MRIRDAKNNTGRWLRSWGNCGGIVFRRLTLPFDSTTIKTDKRKEKFFYEKI